MGVLDKIKNALFEVEYVEVEEPPKKEKKEKKVKHREEEIIEDKPIAKKIVLPGRREEKVEELKEEELLDEDFEIRPKEEEVETEPAKEQFKFMDDNDFKVDEDVYEPEPEMLDSYEPERPLYGEVKREKAYEETKADYYSTPSYNSTRESNNLYGRNNSYNVPVHQYGTYEKEEKTYFKPSPIISPIYGILDKNYKKEDVKEKKEIRLSGYTRSNMNVDDIRNKAYGKKEEVPEELEEVNKFEVEEELDDNVMVDLSDRNKPEVKELTVGDAEEYFEDLGLEYNVDYVDVSTDKKKAKKEETLEEEVVVEKPKHEKLEEDPIEEVETKEDDNDNLFDLIDSMYEE